MIPSINQRIYVGSDPNNKLQMTLANSHGPKNQSLDLSAFNLQYCPGQVFKKLSPNSVF